MKLLTLARREVLFGGASAALVLIALQSQFPTAAILTAAHAGGQAAPGLPPRDIVLLHSDDALAWSFANAARAAMVAAGLRQNVTAATLNAEPAVNHAFIKTTIAAARGKRLLALLSAQDELLLNMALRGLSGVQYIQGLHSAGPGFSRHQIRASTSLPNVSASLAASLHGGAENFVVRSSGPVATSQSFGAAPAMPIMAPWPVALGSLLGELASGGGAAAPNAVMQRGHCTGRGQARASMLIDL